MRKDARRGRRPGTDRAGLRAELLKLLGLAVLFAVVMLVTAWASGGLPIAGR
jgi:hypothetical protein